MSEHASDPAADARSAVLEGFLEVVTSQVLEACRVGAGIANPKLRTSTEVAASMAEHIGLLLRTAAVGAGAEESDLALLVVGKLVEVASKDHPSRLAHIGS